MRGEARPAADDGGQRDAGSLPGVAVRGLGGEPGGGAEGAGRGAAATPSHRRIRRPAPRLGVEAVKEGSMMPPRHRTLPRD